MLNSIKKFKCPICGSKYVSKEAVYSHIEHHHQDEIPKGVSSDQYFYDLTHKGQRTHCTICKQLTPWNPKTHKYHRLCGRPACERRNREIFEERMMRVHNTTNLASDPVHQSKMLAGRRISDVYKWSSGGETLYTGSYEKDFLRVCDLMLDMTVEDVQGPSPNVYRYVYEGKTHFYMPDFYFPDLKLEVEIKDGGDNPNMHPKIQAVDKVKEQLKDKAIAQSRSTNYIKIVNKNYGQFLNLVPQLREQDEGDEWIIIM